MLRRPPWAAADAAAACGVLRRLCLDGAAAADQVVRAGGPAAILTLMATAEAGADSRGAGGAAGAEALLAEGCALLALLSVNVGACAALRAADATGAARRAAVRLLGGVPSPPSPAARGIARLEQALAPAPPTPAVLAIPADSESQQALSFVEQPALAVAQPAAPARLAQPAPRVGDAARELQPHPAVARALRPASATLAGVASGVLRPLSAAAAGRLRPASATFAGPPARMALSLARCGGRPGDAATAVSGTEAFGGRPMEELLLEREIAALRREAESVRNENLRMLSGAVGGSVLAAAAVAAAHTSPARRAGWSPAPAAARPRSGLRLNLERLS